MSTNLIPSPATQQVSFGPFRLLPWAFSREGDSDIGMAIALASIPLWNNRFGVTESHSWICSATERFEFNRFKRMPRDLHTLLGSTVFFATLDSALAT